ncbi:hypothetical protein FHY13_000979 [Xanthomonas arboricola]|nr:hypothetical protein [Xanthomonas euroxanthea]
MHWADQRSAVRAVVLPGEILVVNFFCPFNCLNTEIERQPTRRPWDLVFRGHERPLIP